MPCQQHAHLQARKSFISPGINAGHMASGEGAAYGGPKGHNMRPTARARGGPDSEGETEDLDNATMRK